MRRTQEEGEGRKEEEKGWGTTMTRNERGGACSPHVCDVLSSPLSLIVAAVVVVPVVIIIIIIIIIIITITTTTLIIVITITVAITIVIVIVSARGLWQPPVPPSSR